MSALHTRTRISEQAEDSAAVETIPFPIVPCVEFRMVEGFSAYCVGDDGSFWSRWKRHNGKCRLGFQWHQLRGSTRKDGHIAVQLLDGLSKPTFVLLHRLVLIHFVGPCPDGMECCHFDGNPVNNALDNLRWDTHAANMADAMRHGATPRGSRVGGALLTEEQVSAIKAGLRKKILHRVLATNFKVARQTISSIAQGRIWKHIT